MKKRAVFNYKCRQCGKVYVETEAPKRVADQLMVAAAIRGSEDEINFTVPPRMVEIHTCKGGGLGVSDLVGYTLEEG